MSFPTYKAFNVYFLHPMRYILFTLDISTIVPSNMSSSILSKYAHPETEYFSSISIYTAIDGTQWNTPPEYLIRKERVNNIKSILNVHKIKNKDTYHK